MPNRILRDWTDSEVVDVLDVHAERFFVRLIMKVDDFGRYTANTKMLKSTLFPLKSDIRETDISRWLTACEKSGLISLYNVVSKDYLEIKNFKQRLRQSVEKYPSPVNCLTIDGQLTVNRPHETKPNPEVETESKLEPNGSCQASPDEKEIWKNLLKDKLSVHGFIKTKPSIPEPYFEYWNLFAESYGKPRLMTLTDGRKRKLKTRIKEEEFKIELILAKVKESDFIMSEMWFTFDWIIESQANYIKVLEGNYSRKKETYGTN